MKRIVSAMEARKRFSELLEGVYNRGDEVIVERAGKPIAAIVPVAQYEQWQARRKVAKDRFFATVDEIQKYNKDVSFEEIEATVNEAVKAVRRERRASSASSDSSSP